MMKKILTLTLALALLSVGAAQAKTKVIAHRGYWKTHGSAQNSTAAVDKAAAINVYGSEFDVWMTRDGALVVTHDESINGNAVEDSSVQEVTAVMLDNGEAIPTLDRYLQHFADKPNLQVVLELKSLRDLKREQLAVSEIVSMLKKYDLLDRTDFISFSLSACKAYKKEFPEGRVFYLNGDLSPMMIKSFGFTGMDYEDSLLKRHPEWIAEAHNLGLEVNVWTVNDPKDMNYFLGLGVDYITTDEPEMLQGIMAKQSKAHHTTTSAKTKMGTMK